MFKCCEMRETRREIFLFFEKKILMCVDFCHFNFGLLLKIDFDCARATNDVEERDDEYDDDDDDGVSDCVRSKTNDRSRPISKKREKQKEDDDDEKRTEEFAARQRGRRRKERKTFKSKQQMQ